MKEIESFRYLNKTEYHVLYMIDNFKTRYGYSPTVREICQECFLSESHVYRILKKLERCGYIKRRTKTIVVVEPW